MKNNTKTVGDIAEMVAIAEMVKAGYIVSRPLSDNASYDFIYDGGNGLRRAQVKGRTPYKGAITVELYCNARSYSGKYNSTDFDDVVIVNIETYEVAVLASEEIFTSEATFKSFKLRIDPPKNNQTNRVKMFVDYSIIPANAQGVRPSC